MATTGADLANDERCGYQTVNAIKNSHAGAAAPGSPVAGVLFWDTSSSQLKVYNGAGWDVVESSSGIAIDGMIVAYNPGYYTNGSNGGFTVVGPSANTVAAINTYINSDGWYVCNGAAVNNASSLIWNAASRYLPNLTDSRFIMGDTAIGGTGGSNTQAHTHDIDFPDTTSAESSPNDNYANISPSVVVASSHTHNFNIASFASGAASNAENRPVYLAVVYIVKVY